MIKSDSRASKPAYAEVVYAQCNVRRSAWCTKWTVSALRHFSVESKTTNNYANGASLINLRCTCTCTFTLTDKIHVNTGWFATPLPFSIFSRFSTNCLFIKTAVRLLQKIPEYTPRPFSLGRYRQGCDNTFSTGRAAHMRQLSRKRSNKRCAY